MIRSLDESSQFLELRERIRDVVDFPSKGILFKDITPLLSDARLFARAVEHLAEPFAKDKIDYVLAPESRGFILGAALALKLGAGFIPLRKEGRLPRQTIHVRYSMEYRPAEEEAGPVNFLHMHEDAFRHGARVLIVDDVLATGGTAWASKALAETLGATVAGAAFLIELGSLRGREKLGGSFRILSLLKY